MLKRSAFIASLVLLTVALSVAAAWFVGCGQVSETTTTTTTSTTTSSTTTSTTTTTTTTTTPPGENWYKSGTGDFSVRGGHTSVDTSFSPDRMWVIGGGTTGLVIKNDVWYSENGSSWTLARAAAEFSPRAFHSSLVFDNKIWVIGGTTSWPSVAPTNEVWYSENGAIWTLATADAAFSPRYAQSSVVFDAGTGERMWVIAGKTAGGSDNQVWYSDNGAAWTKIADKIAFEGRLSHSSVVFNDKIWIIGGKIGTVVTNEVWSSSNARDWTQGSNAPFTPRRCHTSLVYDGKIWVIGGLDGSNVSLDDVWYTTDGSSWTQATAAAEYAAIGTHTSVVFDDKMWVIGGVTDFSTFTATDEVWYSPGP